MLQSSFKIKSKKNETDRIKIKALSLYLSEPLSLLEVVKLSKLKHPNDFNGSMGLNVDLLQWDTGRSMPSARRVGERFGHRRRLRGGRRTDMNPSIPRVATLSDVARHRTRCTAAAWHSEINTEAMEKAASADHRVRPAVLRWHSGHSGVMTAVSIGLAQQSAACPGRT